MYSTALYICTVARILAGAIYCKIPYSTCHLWYQSYREGGNKLHPVLDSSSANTHPHSPSASSPTPFTHHSHLVAAMSQSWIITSARLCQPPRCSYIAVMCHLFCSSREPWAARRSYRPTPITGDQTRYLRLSSFISCTIRCI